MSKNFFVRAKQNIYLNTIIHKQNCKQEKTLEENVLFKNKFANIVFLLLFLVTCVNCSYLYKMRPIYYLGGDVSCRKLEMVTLPNIDIKNSQQTNQNTLEIQHI